MRDEDGSADVGASGRLAEALVVLAALLLLGGDWLLGSFMGAGQLPPVVELGAAEVLVLVVVRRRWSGARWTMAYPAILLALTAAVSAPIASAGLAVVRHIDVLAASSMPDVVLTLVQWAGAATLVAGTWLTWVQADRAGDHAPRKRAVRPRRWIRSSARPDVSESQLANKHVRHGAGSAAGPARHLG